MTIAYWCLFLAGLMPWLTIAIAKLGRADYNNAEPRAWLETQSGLRRRADYAHRNHFEAFPFFAAGIIIAHQVHATQHTINLLAIIFIIARIFYTFFYLKNYPSLRSVAWFIASFAAIGLFILAAYTK